VSRIHRFGYHVFLHGRLFFATQTLQTLPRGARLVFSLRSVYTRLYIAEGLILTVWHIVELPGTVICEYKARERIHRGVADPRLLAIPTSCGRVADHNPN